MYVARNLADTSAVEPDDIVDNINIVNRFAVAKFNNKIVIQNLLQLEGPITVDEALLLAAYLVLMADRPTIRFPAVCNAVAKSLFGDSPCDPQTKS
jgi:hypothetical protein